MTPKKSNPRPWLKVSAEQSAESLTKALLSALATAPDVDVLLSRSEAAALLGVDYTTLYHWTRRGVFPSVLRGSPNGKHYYSWHGLRNALRVLISRGLYPGFYNQGKSGPVRSSST